MVLLGLLFVVTAVILGASTAFVLWPVFCVGAALLYCLPRGQRRTARLTFASVGVLAAIAYRLGPWRASTHAPGVYVWFAVPLLLGALLVLGAGGPKRIKARHARREEEARLARAAEAARLRADREARGAGRREARRAKIEQRTGVDVAVVSATAGRWTRAVGGRVTRRLSRNHPPPPRRQGPPDLLDLDQDVDAQLSRQRSEEILRLAGQLDDVRRPRPRPQPGGRS